VHAEKIRSASDRKYKCEALVILPSLI